MHSHKLTGQEYICVTAAALALLTGCAHHPPPRQSTADLGHAGQQYGRKQQEGPEPADYAQGVVPLDLVGLPLQA